jgi:RNA polymerase sigma-70 factor (ECF subfamily)
MMDEENFDQLMARLRAGDADAAATVFNRFAHRLIGLARAQLDDGIRRKEDPEDIVQSVYRSFFRRQRAGEFQLDSWESLWVVLTVITLRKCGNHIEYFHAARRDVAREARLPPGEAWKTLEAVAARDPTPSEAAVLAETVEELLRGLETFDREVLVLQLQGCTIPEISAQVTRAERTVRRAIERIRRRLSRLQAEAVN